MGVIRWAAQVVEALLSIYSMFDGCVHGDLRLKNVLVGKYFIVIKHFVFNWFYTQGKKNIRLRNYQSTDKNIALKRHPRSITRIKIKGWIISLFHVRRAFLVQGLSRRFPNLGLSTL